MLLHTASAAETAELAATLAELMVAGDLVLLAGEMGAGKTAFAQGFGVGLGVEEPITSPTFTLMHEYAGRVPLYHLDVYRLDNLDEVLDLALPELIDGDAVTIIEWGDVIATILTPDYLQVSFHLGEGDDERDIVLAFVGPRWSARERVVREAVQRWSASSC